MSEKTAEQKTKKETSKKNTNPAPAADKVQKTKKETSKKPAGLPAATPEEKTPSTLQVGQVWMSEKHPDRTYVVVSIHKRRDEPEIIEAKVAGDQGVLSSKAFSAAEFEKNGYQVIRTMNAAEMEEWKAERMAVKEESAAAVGKTIKKDKLEKAPRKMPYAGKKIKILVKENPKRAGSGAHARFALYKNGMSVEAAITAGVTNGDIAFDLKHEFITLQ